ncbi:hypothetical protein [Leptospira santarosai]|uniref:Lipoprotein n=1 Tax=Leptospira santarosai TaxID=28183 RepID=A0AB73NEG4_9LEPT|nr:hypothetical protein [Leptospira santarosai]ASV11949.1 hypothetical protein B2G51_09750 [Leptospira santarosai]AVV51599.1 Uncharacterized protein XB17_03024 [Leptospira santarosai]MDO6382403.1 hypothetical protein [Leptospira santarosai]OLY65437.1 hypothetical protein BWD11_02635 [Leptospira santarosai serovar Grippotyphosa]ONF78777.1 hypothetical protein BWD12_10845 [Leptospira santarosai serovar Bananal]
MRRFITVGVQVILTVVFLLNVVVVSLLINGNCGPSEQETLKTVPVPKNLDTRCEFPEIHVRRFRQAPNREQKGNGRPGTGIAKATIDCKRFQVNVVAQYDSLANGGNLLTVHYGKKQIELYRQEWGQDAYGDGYLNFLGVDDKSIYYSVSNGSITGITQTYYCFNWRSGKTGILDSDSEICKGR